MSSFWLLVEETHACFLQGSQGPLFSPGASRQAGTRCLWIPPHKCQVLGVNICSTHWALNYTICWNKPVSSCSWWTSLSSVLHRAIPTPAGCEFKMLHMLGTSPSVYRIVLSELLSHQLAMICWYVGLGRRCLWLHVLEMREWFLLRGTRWKGPVVLTKATQLAYQPWEDGIEFIPTT